MISTPKSSRVDRSSSGAVLKRSERKFAVMLILLLAIMAVAPTAVLEYVVQTNAAGQPLNTRIILSAVISLTGGFLFMAGGLGLWAFRSSMMAERMALIGRFVDAMQYVSDGLMILTRDGCIGGANQAARNLADRLLTDSPRLQSVFPALSDQDVKNLLDVNEHYEIEKDDVGQNRTLRFRSQFEEGIHICQVSDITPQREKARVHQTQARLQFIGRVSRGLAHDFNNILCAISGHASLIQRQEPDPKDESSLAMIIRESNRGASLARRLLDLGETHSLNFDQSLKLQDLITGTKELFQVALTSAYDILYDLDPENVDVAMGGAQLEQVVMNLGVLAADHADEHNRLCIYMRYVGIGVHQYAEVVEISVFVDSGENSEGAGLIEIDLQEIDRTGGDGVMLSLVATLVEECGGQIVKLVDPQKHERGYRFLLPARKIRPPQKTNDRRRHAWSSGFVDGKILLGIEDPMRRQEFADFAKEQSLTIEIVWQLPDLLRQLEKAGAWQLILIDEDLLEGEEDAVLRVIRTLHPKAKLVALSHTPDEPDVIAQKADALLVSRLLSPLEIFMKLSRYFKT